jgi:hypothetical protein
MSTQANSFPAYSCRAVAEWFSSAAFSSPTFRSNYAASFFGPCRLFDLVDSFCHVTVPFDDIPGLRSLL